jgi:hypothetical protein
MLAKYFVTTRGVAISRKGAKAQSSEGNVP